MPMSKVANIARAAAVLAVVLFVGGPLGTMVGLLPPLTGFYAFGLGALAGLVAFGLGGVGAILTRKGSGVEGRGRAFTALGAGGAIMAVFLIVLAGAPEVPPIHDITTNPADPPMFTTSPADRPEAYPAENAGLQAAAYPDLTTIALDVPPAEAVAKIAGAFESFGWEVTLHDEAAGAVEGYETSRVFRFVDDVVVRVRASGAGSAVDIRSRSRVGQSDLGANAARIRRIRDAL